jgi:WD40 repeat protein
MAADGPANPYVGPRPFERDDAPRFFGRAREVRDVASLVVAQRVLLLYSASGAGKSSLLNAGVLPKLDEEKGFDVLPVGRLHAENVPKDENVFVAGLLSSLEDSNTSLSKVLERRPKPSGSHLRVLVVDQFEELFTLHPGRWHDRPGLFEQLAAALERDAGLRVVLATREDFLASLDVFANMLPGGLRTRFRLERLDRASALAAVTNPLAGTGRAFAPGVAEKLVDDLLRFRVTTERGESEEVEGQYVEPVQLQVACRTLWADLPTDVTEITSEHLRTYADVDQVLTRFYDKAVAAAAVRNRRRERRIREWVGRVMITPGGTRGAAYAGPDETAGMSNDVVRALEEKRVIRAEWRAGARWYELTHDRLIDPIRRSNEAFRNRLLRRRAAALTALGAAGALGAVLAVFLAAGSSESTVTTSTVTTVATGAQGERILEGDVSDPIVAAAPIGDGSRIASVTRSGTFRMVPIDGERSDTFEVGEDVQAAAFSSDGRLALVALENGALDEWDLESGRKRRGVDIERGPLTAIAFAPDGRRAALASGDEVAILDMETHEVVTRSFKADVTAVAFHPNGRKFAAGLAIGRVEVAPIDGRIQHFVGGTRRVRAVAFNHEGTRLVAGSDHVTARIWSVADGNLITAIPVGTGSILTAAFSPGGDRIVAGGGDSVESVWRWRPFEGFNLTLPADIERFQQEQGLTATLPDSEVGKVGPKTLAAVQRVGSEIRLVGHTDDVTSTSFTPDGGDVVTASADGSIRIWGVLGAGRRAACASCRGAVANLTCGSLVD